MWGAKDKYYLLEKLSRYEAAYKRALELAQANIKNSGGAVIVLASPLLDSVKLYKERIAEIRATIRSLND